MSSSACRLLTDAGLDPDEIGDLVRRVIAEDLGAGDLTSALTVPAQARLDVCYVARQAGTLCGLPVLSAVVEAVTGDPASGAPDGSVALSLLAQDGQPISPGDAVARLTGSARSILALERTSLNLLGHLSGVATATHRWADAVADTGARVRDTRKTMPLLRSMEKYAIRCGGGTNHRVGLFDGILIKDNHIAAAGGIGAALDAIRCSARPDVSIVQVEVDDLDQLDEALAHGAEQILLDNFDLDVMREAVRRVRAAAPHVVLEASGGLTLDRAHAVASTGVDLLAIGSLTHSAVSLDLGLDVVIADRATATAAR